MDSNWQRRWKGGRAGTKELELMAEMSLDVAPLKNLEYVKRMLTLAETRPHAADAPPRSP